ncbi:hypothetical protein AQI70_36680 [Streptomyces curacoi]|uniref:Uncharacterized protein n=1 Tax=Streptomyces curacoi TaxID=146536 RepID=A0A124GTT4_9ACTN|nr:hypothetical protein AQI70_36680 [Streptomyces curacoi]
MEPDPFRRADLSSAGIPKPGPAPGRHAVTEQGIAAGFLGDVTAWTLFGMIFDSMAPEKSPRTHSGDQRRSQV